jgi:hypothetical protein
MNMENFSKYFGVQGILAIALLIGYVFMSINMRQPTPTYENLMFIVLGYYFAKNGVGIIAALRGIQPARREEDQKKDGI